MEIKPIAYIRNGFKSKFGIPRQSGLCNIQSLIVFEKEYNIPEAFRGLEEFSHIWLIWGFSEFQNKTWTPTVRPPRLGGNKRVGVFSTRSPHRPNSLGLSSVKLLKIIKDEKQGIVLQIEGADLMDKTPIYDIKPYISYSDSHQQAICGFADDYANYNVDVTLPDDVISDASENVLNDIIAILSKDPKPSYQRDENRVYGMIYGDY
jgi:tRNA-Thr(GGU) m(6)t(6)A37 methyltransferase TsaA